jgi:hypothetical protein
MGSASSAPFLSVRALVLASLTGVLVSQIASAAASTQLAPQEPTSALVKGKPKPAARKRYERFEYEIGIGIWTERVQMSSSTRELSVNSNATSLVFGGDWRRGNSSTGLVYQADLMYGNITNQAESNAIVYEKGRDRVYGVNGGVGYYYRIPTSRAEFSLLAEGRYRKADHTAPAGYSFGDDDQIVAAFGVIDLMIPISKSITIFQKFSVPITDKRMQSVWVMGLRL